MSPDAPGVRILLPSGRNFPFQAPEGLHCRLGAEELMGGGGQGREALLRSQLCPFRPGHFTYHIPVSSSTPLHLRLTLQMK